MAYNMYHLYKKQYSEDSGTTWYDVNPLVTIPSGSPVSTGYSTLETCENVFKDYLVFEALEDGFAIDFIIPSGQSQTWIEYSVDNRITWHNTPTGSTYGGAKIISPPSINAGEKIYWRGRVHGNDSWDGGRYNGFTQTYCSDPKRFNVSGNSLSIAYGSSFDSYELSSTGWGFPEALFTGTMVTDASGLKLPKCGDGSGGNSGNGFQYMFSGCTAMTIPPSLTNSIAEGGNVMGMFEGCTSLIRVPDFPHIMNGSIDARSMFGGCTSLTSVPSDMLPATSMTNSEYGFMFSKCTGLTNAPELPATTLSPMCYYYMFSMCTSLTTPPDLPATVLKKECYANMFNECTSLTIAPKISATTLAESCCSGMFSACYNLVKGPELIAKNLEKYCYYEMFSLCTSLNELTCLAETGYSGWGPTYRPPMYEWMFDVPSGGTFYKKSGVSAINHYIPGGWTVIDVP